MNILITGASGQLGSSIKYVSKDYKNLNFFFTDINELNILKYENIYFYVKKNNIDALVNCAAYTNVEQAEIEIKKCNLLNHLAVENIARVCSETNIKLIHISTDYVFEGNVNKKLKENDETNPKSVYGKSKLKGELAIKKINPKKSIVIRTSWLYSQFGKNFIKTLNNLSFKKKEIKLVNDQIGSPTSAIDLAKVIIKIIPMINNLEVEIYHYSNLGSCSWYEFGREFFKLSNKKNTVIPILTEKINQIAKRPKYSVMDKTKIIEKFNLKINSWKLSLNQLIIKSEYES